VRTLAAALVALALLAGCAHQRAPSDASSDAALREVARSFALQGKLAVANDGKGYNAALRWRQDGDEVDLTVNGPVGIGRTRLTGTPLEMRIITSRGEQLVYDDPAQALFDQLGWSLPLDALNYWVAGVPAPSARAAPLAPKSAAPGARRWRQAGWDVEVAALGAFDAGPLPRKLTYIQGGTRLRLVVSDWQVPLPPR